MNPAIGGEYSYESSGFDGFLSRSIDDLAQVTLDSPGPQSTAIPFDRGQQSGSFGNSINLGNIVFDGVNGTITMKDPNSDSAIVFNGQTRTIAIHDTNNTRVVLGQLPDTSYGWAVSKPGVDVQNGF